MLSDVQAIQAGDGAAMQSRSDRCAVVIKGESMTVQAQAEDADINVLMKRFGITHQLPQSPRVPMYGDFTEVNDYRSAIEAVRAADAAFMEFPAELRSKFDNDPQKLLLFMENRANLPIAKQLGLVKEEIANVSGSKPVQQASADVGVAAGAAASGAG